MYVALETTASLSLLQQAVPYLMVNTSRLPKIDLSSLGVLLDVALEVNLGTLWKEAFAALSAAFAKDIAACFGANTGTETVLTFADTLGRLVSAFHIERRYWLLMAR